MKPGWLIVLAAVAALLGMAGLRINQQKAIAMKNHIVQLDIDGHPVDTEIRELQEFVFSHMNTSVKFELVGSFQRAQRAAEEAATQTPSPNDEAIYAQAQAECDIEGVSSVDQAACVAAFLEARLTPTESPQPVAEVSSRPYEFTFVAPRWTPDLPGLSLFAAIILAITSVTVYWSRLLRGQL